MTDTTTDPASPAPDPDEQRPEPAVTAADPADPADPATDEAVTPRPATPSRSGASPIAWVVALGLAAMVGTLLFVGGYLAAGGASGSCVAPSEAFAPFCDAYAKLKAQYVDQLDDSKLAEGAIQGMFEHGVQDPFSGYMSPDDYQRALGDLSGQFSGIGAEMGVRNLDNPDDLEACTSFSETCALVVVAPLEDSPAEKAGLRAGDIVTAIDGESVNGLSLEDAVKQVRGESGTQVTLSLRRDDRPLEMTITRADITMREVTSRMLDDNIGYVALHGFSNPSSDQFHDAIAGLLDDGADQLRLRPARQPRRLHRRGQQDRVRVHQERPGLHAGVGRGRREALGGDRRRPRHRSGDPGGGAGQQRLGLRIGDRVGGAQGAWTGDRHRAAHLWQEHGAALGPAG